MTTIVFVWAAVACLGLIAVVNTALALAAFGILAAYLCFGFRLTPESDQSGTAVKLMVAACTASVFAGVLFFACALVLNQWGLA